jgi:peroxiredoxin Q/BCP
MGIKTGDRAPEFSLPTQDGTELTLRNLLEKSAVVLYFYPMDNTPGCTAEARSFRDAYADFQEAGAEVVGVSSQSPQSHQGFAQENCLPFKLVSDQGGKLRELYGVPKALGLLPGRVTFVIDRQGIVRHVFNSQLRIGRHVTEALEVLKQLKQ